MDEDQGGEVRQRRHEPAHRVGEVEHLQSGIGGKDGVDPDDSQHARAHHRDNEGQPRPPQPSQDARAHFHEAAEHIGKSHIGQPHHAHGDDSVPVGVGIGDIKA